MLPPIPENESERLSALRRCEILDTLPEPAFDRVTRLAATLFNVPIALVSLVDEDRQWFKAKVGLEARETPREHSFCAHALDVDDLLIVRDALADVRFAKNPLVTGEPHIRFYAGAALRTRDGFALGRLCIIDDKSRPVVSASEREALADLAAMVMSHIEMRQMVGYVAPVTWLSNRFRLLEDIDALINENAGVFERALVVIDSLAPEQYQDLVTALGHAFVDTFTLEAIALIQAYLPKSTKLYQVSVARYAYVCVIGDRAAFERSVDSLRLMLCEPLRCQNIPIVPRARIGSAQFFDNTKSAEQLLRAATTATHNPNPSTFGGFWYDEKSDLAHQRAFKLLTDLPAALAASDQLSLLYQPKIELATRACLGAEALLRWDHPELGRISPVEFIPLVERTALMPSLTEWVLRQGIRQLDSWRRASINIRLAINISMLDLERSDFTSIVAAQLKVFNVKPSSLALEVTESALALDIATASHRLQELRQIGVEIAIDDFGTGQSALSYLKHIPANVVKIDQLFIRSLCKESSDQCMVRSTIDLAHDLGFRVVAEGIESAEAFSWLSEHGCDVGQGYLISRPLSADDFRAWFDREGVASNESRFELGVDARLVQGVNPTSLSPAAI
jgi:EAL domain-containing protein (putative c-di-GMP-specific phosphodiesterase class I)